MIPLEYGTYSVGVRNLFRWSTEFIPLEYGIYSVGVRNLFRWSTEFIPLEYGIYSVGVRNLFGPKRNKFRTPKPITYLIVAMAVPTC